MSHSREQTGLERAKVILHQMRLGNPSFGPQDFETVMAEFALRPKDLGLSEEEIATVKSDSARVRAKYHQ